MRSRTVVFGDKEKRIRVCWVESRFDCLASWIRDRARHQPAEASCVVRAIALQLASVDRACQVAVDKADSRVRSERNSLAQAIHKNVPRATATTTGV